MIKSLIILLFTLLICISSFSQSIGIGTSSPDASALVDITNTGKGLLIPRMSTSGITSIINPARGLMVYDSTKNQLMVNMGSAAVPDWQTIVFKSGWSLSGNSGTDTSEHFIGTKDNMPLRFKVNNQPAGKIEHTSPGGTGFGFGVLKNNTTGKANTATGYQALSSNSNGSYLTANGYQALYSNTSGFYNIATGYQSLYSNLTGVSNVANGFMALYSNTSGSYNTANGLQALYSNTTGSSNTANGFGAMYFNNADSNIATGYKALFSNTTGNNNIANGFESLYSNTSGSKNVANGAGALYSNIIGISNVANGYQALYSNTSSYNIATGYQALYFNTSGFSNIATGSSALYSNTTGVNNIATGATALYSNTIGGANVANGTRALYANTTGNSNTAYGYNALIDNTTGNGNTAIGSAAGNNAGTTPSNFTAIGSNAGHVSSISNRVEIGNTSVNWIGGQVGWSTYSDEKIKDDIKDNVPGLSFIKKLRPVTYRLNVKKQNLLCNINDDNEWDGKYDIEQQIQTGFIAQEVEQAARTLQFNFSGVTPPKDNSKLYSLQYSAFVVPLVKAVQEQQLMIEKLEKQNELLLRRLDILERNNK